MEIRNQHPLIYPLVAIRSMRYFNVHVESLGVAICKAWEKVLLAFMIPYHNKSIVVQERASGARLCTRIHCPPPTMCNSLWRT